MHASSALRASVWAVGVALLLVACESSSTQEPVRSYLEGAITVSTSIDSTADYSGFEVMVVNGNGRQIDTLGRAETNREGRYRMQVEAAQRGVYPLIVWGRAGRQRLLTTEYVVADGDSETMSLRIARRRRRMPVRETENADLQAYRNTMVQHRQNLVQRLQTAGYDETPVMQSVRLTSSILWGLRDTYPGTYAADLAAVESLALLEDWKDSLVVARAQQIEPSNPRFVEAVRIARRAEARLRGQEAALELVDQLRAKAQSDSQQAAMQAIIVRAYIDSLDADRARAAAQSLRERYPRSPWSEWADGALYEVGHLLPGMAAPSFAVRTLRGDSLTLDSLQGHPVVLEFHRPGNDLFIQQIPNRNALYEATRPDSVAFVSVSLEPDTVLNQAFFDGRQLPGHHVIADGGGEGPLAEAYNVAVVPTRILLDAQGKIIDKYIGSAFLRLQSDLTELLESRPPIPPDSAPPDSAPPDSAQASSTRTTTD